MSNNIHPTIAASIAHWMPQPVSNADQQAQALTADIEANYDKAHRANNDAFIKAMFAQINDKTGSFQ